MTIILEEQKISKLFTITLIVKTIQGFLELVGGILLLVVSADSLIAFVIRFTQEELAENPRDFIFHPLLQSAHQLAITGPTFAAFYLIGHGAIKVFLIIGVMHKKLWAYYAFESIMLIFIVLEIHRLSMTGSNFLFAMTLFDVLIVWLTWHESELLKEHLEGQK